MSENENTAGNPATQEADKRLTSRTLFGFCLQRFLPCETGQAISDRAMGGVVIIASNLEDYLQRFLPNVKLGREFECVWTFNVAEQEECHRIIEAGCNRAVL